eukprot:Em0023g57a
MASASRLSQSIATHTRVWYGMDARGQIVGRLAATLSLLLQGKTKPIYHPAADTGDHVVVTNTRHVTFTGNKWDQKLYRHHTGYPSALREIQANHLHEKDPTKVLWKAVYGMLPKNNLRKKRMRRLHLFPDMEHPYEANIYCAIPGPCPAVKKLQDYTAEEVQNYPQIVKETHV